MSLSDRFLIGVDSESNYGDDAFGGSDPSEWLAVQGEPEIEERTTEVGPEQKTYDGLGGHVLRYADATEVSLSTFIVGKDGSAGDPPPDPLASLLKAGNFEETVNTDTDVVYTLNGYSSGMTDVPSATVFEAIRDDTDGDYYTRLVEGVRWGLSFTFEDEGSVVVEADGVGLYSERAVSTSSISDPADGDVSGGKDRLKVQGMTFKFDGTEYDVTSAEMSTELSVQEHAILNQDSRVDEVKLSLGDEDRPGGSVTFKGRSDELTDIVRDQIQPDAGGFDKVPTGDLEIEVGDGTDTVTFVGKDCVLGAYSKSLEGNNYNFDVPVTFLGGLEITFD